MAESRLRLREEGEGTTTTTIVENGSRAMQASPNVVLKLKKPETDKKVKWDQQTVDNEHMDKKKSKCCCVYEKPKLFGESSDDDDSGDDGCTNHCRGHRKRDYNRLPPSNQEPDSSNQPPPL